MVEPNTADPIAVTSEAIKALHAEWDELAKMYPAPTRDDVRPEWQWVHGRAEDGTLDPDGKYAGFHIAVYNQQIVGADYDYLRMRVELARKLGIHPERMVIYWVPDA